MVGLKPDQAVPLDRLGMVVGSAFETAPRTRLVLVRGVISSVGLVMPPAWYGGVRRTGAG